MFMNLRSLFRGVHVAVGCCAVVCFSSCDAGLQAPESKPPPPSKRVIAKESPVENRFSAWDTFTRGGIHTKTETVYYLIAEDGTAVEVEMGEWVRVKIGDSYSTSGWTKR